MRRTILAAACAALTVLGVATPAQGAFDDPLFFYTPPPPGENEAPKPPPSGHLNAPCGLAVSSGGSIYVSDYYDRSVDVFEPFGGTLEYASQPLAASSGLENPHTGPVDDPCGLAFDSTGALYVNDYHREVVRFPTPISLTNANNKAIDTGDPTDVYDNPTGVAVDQSTNHAFVDDRAYVAERTSSGALVQKIGEGTLQDGYGIAVSGYPATAGYLYVPDAATKTVKVYDPATDTANPIASLAKPGGFGSLVDSSIAVDNSTGEIYVTDTLGPQLTESPQAIVYVFSSTGGYEGRLKYATINAAPSGLAVDNSGTATQSRVYVTSGVEEASIYGYPPHAATSASASPLGSAAGGGALGSSGSATASATAAPASLGSTTSASGSDSSPAEGGASEEPASKPATRRRIAHRHRRSHVHHRKRKRR